MAVFRGGKSKSGVGNPMAPPPLNKTLCNISYARLHQISTTTSYGTTTTHVSASTKLPLKLARHGHSSRMKYKGQLDHAMHGTGTW